MDAFCEQVVKRKFTIAHKILIFVVGALFATVEFVCAYITVAIYSSVMLTFTICIAIVAISVLLFMIPRLKNVEYDYSVTGNTLSVDKVINANRRKKFARVEVNTIEAMGKLMDNDIPVYKYGKERDASDGNDENTYYCVYTSDKGKCLLLFSPNEKILTGMKPHLNRELVIKHFYKK